MPYCLFFVIQLFTKVPLCHFYRQQGYETMRGTRIGKVTNETQNKQYYDTRKIQPSNKHARIC
jgi:hypothetical protein